MGIEEGDRVYTYTHPLSHRGCRARNHNGAWAEYMLVPFRRVAVAPASLDLTHVGAAPIVGLTAHETVIDVLKVEKHDVVLITAAAGESGTSPCRSPPAVEARRPCKRGATFKAGWSG